MPVKPVSVALKDVHLHTGISAKDLKLLQERRRELSKKPSETADKAYMGAFSEMVEKSAKNQGIALTPGQKDAAAQDAAEYCKRDLGWANEYARSHKRSFVHSAVGFIIGGAVGFGLTLLEPMGNAAQAGWSLAYGSMGWFFGSFERFTKITQGCRDSSLVSTAYAIKAAVKDASQK